MKYSDLSQELKKEIYSRDFKNLGMSFLGIIFIPLILMSFVDFFVTKGNEINSFNIYYAFLGLLFFSSLFHLPIFIGLLFHYAKEK